MTTNSVRAYHYPTKEWRFACYGQDNKYVRLDPRRGERLEDFIAYEVEVLSKDENNKETFKTLKELRLPKVLS